MINFDKVYNISDKWAIGIVSDDEVVYLLDRRYPMNNRPYQVTNGSYYIDTILEHNDGLQLDLSVKDWFVNKYDIEVVKIRLRQYLNGN